MAGFTKQFLLISTLCLSACSTTQIPNSISEEIPLLVHTKWREAPPSKVTLTFKPSYMGGMGGCNGAGAGYLQDGWNLESTGALPSTVIACDEALMVEDYRLSNALASVRTFTITESNRLILFDENKRKLLVLNRDTLKVP